MKKIILNLVVIFALGAAGFGVTKAIFTDTETSVGNIFTAGILDLSVNTLNPITTEHFALSNVKPGDNGSYTFNFKNEGTVDAGHLYLDVANLVDSPGLTPDPEPLPDLGEISTSTIITIYESNGMTVVWTGTLKALDTLAAPGVELLEGGAGLIAGATKTVILKAELPLATVGNEIMGDSAVFDIVAVLNQE